MPRKKLIVHGCWLLAVLAAFALGSLRNGGSATDQTSATGTSSKSARSSGGSATTGPGGAPLRTDGKTSTLRGSGPLSEIAGTASFSGGDWENLAREALKSSNPITRRLAFSRLLESLTPENALAIREQLVAFGAGGAEWRDFNYSWGALAGKEAIMFAADSEEDDLAATLSGWASADPAGALALLDNLPENMRDSRNRLAESVVAGLADRDPSLATDLVLRLAAEGNDRAGNLIELVANRAIRSSSPEEAARWSETLPDGALKGAAMDRVANAYVARDPEAAAQWAERFADQPYAARVIEEVGDEWGERDPVAAVTWLETLPEGPGQTSGLTSVFGDWEDRDPVAAGQYLMNMPQSAQRDSAISGFARGYAWQDPQTAIAWAQDIGDPNLRQQTLTSAGQAFMRRDPTSARAWLENSGLTPEAREAILTPRRR